MKRLYALTVALLLTASYASAQIVTERCWHLDKVQFLEHKQDFWRSHKMFSTTASRVSGVTGGFYNLTEAQYGFGLKLIDEPYAEYYAGLTTEFGWRFASGIALGGGIGYHQYNGGYDIPIFGDARWYIGKQRVKRYGCRGLHGEFQGFQRPIKSLCQPRRRDYRAAFKESSTLFCYRAAYPVGPKYL